VLGVNRWVQGNGLRAVLLLTSHQCSSHCENSRVRLRGESRGGRPQIIPDTPNGVQSGDIETLFSFFTRGIEQGTDLHSGRGVAQQESARFCETNSHPTTQNHVKMLNYLFYFSANAFNFQRTSLTNINEGFFCGRS